MKNLSLALLILFSVLIFLPCCDSTCPPVDENYANLIVKWDGNIIYNETLDENNISTTKILMMPDGSELEITKYARKLYNDPNDAEKWLFSCLASKEGYFSIFPECGELETIEINGDTDFTAVDPQMVCGLVYNEYYGPIISADINILNKADSSFVMMISTLDMGRYSIDLDFGEYLISYDSEIVEYNVDSFYHDIELEYVAMDEKPNIYLYPEEETRMDVMIDFPKGGMVTVSDPSYGEGWMDLKVTPDGIINDKHDFLFYECATSDYPNLDAGWVIAQTDLQDFFNKNLKDTGFVGREIDDFIEFWIPKFTENKFYEIYPLYQKELDEKVILNFSKQPDNMQRLTYVMKGRDDNKLKLDKPEIPAFERKGFVVTEWGVIRK